MDRRGRVVNGEACRGWRGDLAARALGLRDALRDPGLDAHLDGCADCRADLDDLRAVAAALDLADPERLAHPGADPELGDRIVARIRTEAGVTRRRRWAWVSSAAALVVVAAAVAVGALVALGGDGDSTRRVELAGPAGAGGSAELVERAWGTEVALEVVGLDAGEVYWLWLSDAGGDRVVAGTLTGTGGEARAVLASALAFDDARRIWMTDEADAVVLDAPIAAG